MPARPPFSPEVHEWGEGSHRFPSVARLARAGAWSRRRRFWRKRSRLGRGLVAAVALLFVVCAALAVVAWDHRQQMKHQEALKEQEIRLRARPGTRREWKQRRM